MGRWLCTNNRSDTVSLLDATVVGQAVLPELVQAPVGLNPLEIEGPHHAAISADGKTYFIGLSQYAPGTGSGPHGAHGSGSVPGSILKYASADHSLIGSVRVDRNPGDLALSPDGRVLAVSHYDLLLISDAAQMKAPSPDARVYLIDPDTLEVQARITTCAAPHGLAYSKDGKRLYVACYSDEVAVIALDDSNHPVTHVKVAPNAGDAFRAVHQPYALSVSQSTGDVFVSCLSSGEVRVMKADLTIDSSRTIAIGGNPFLSTFSIDGTSLFVPRQGDDALVEFDPSTLALKRTVPLPRAACTNVHQVTASPDGRYLMTVCEGDHVTNGSLLVLEAQSAQLISSTTLGIFPDFVGLVRP